ncbi:MAG: hypothetical protein IT440_10885 [Phycisphaeraceae bacterium]|nr:hypothetical protein [Phycisphaeraceae bacterium]
MGCRKDRPGNRIGLTVLTAGLAALIWCAGASAADDGKADPWAEFKDSGIKFSIDFGALMKNKELLTKELQDKVWILKPSSGKQLLQLPIILIPGKKPYAVDGGFIKIVGARFLCYRLDDYEARDEKNELWEQNKRDWAQVNAGTKVEYKEEDELFATPRLAKSFELTANGKIKWTMDRLPPNNAEIQESTKNLYTFRLDAQKLQKSRPEPPKQPANRGDRDAMTQFQTEMMEYRHLNSQWLETSKTVRELSANFEDAVPTRVWAVYEFPLFKDSVEITEGPPPLPWSISTEMLDFLRETVEQQVKAEKSLTGQVMLPPADQLRVTRLGELAQNPHVLNRRLAATYIADTDMVQYAEMGGPLFFVLQGLLDGDDDMSRNLITMQLTRTMPTRATAELLKRVALRAGSNAAQAAKAINTIFEIDLSGDPAQVQDRIATVNQLLGDEHGAPPEQILTPLMKSAAQQPQMQMMLVKSVQLQSLPGSRLTAVLVYTVENAGVEPLASAWLDQQFLGSGNRDLVRQTLDVISNASTGAQDLGPAFDWAVGHLFGPPPKGADNAARHARLRGLIPIDSTQHSMFRALQHGDAALNRLAWRALSRFTLPQMDPASAATGTQKDRYQLILDAALDQIPTPGEVVPFLKAQPDAMRAAQTLTQIVLRGSRGASSAAMRSLVGSGMPLDQVLNQLSPSERQAMAMLAYQIAGRMDPPPLVANTLRRREDDNPVAAWFGKQLASGILPNPAAWAAQFRNEDELLDLLVSSDPGLSSGAAGALVCSLGGSDWLAMQFLKEVQLLPDQTKATIKKAWESQQKSISALQLQTLQGAYRLTLRVAEAQEGADAAKVLATGANELPLGIVQMTVDPKARTVSLGSQAIKTSLASKPQSIQIDQPADLKSFPNEEVGKMPLEQVTEPIVLQRDVSDGIWRGRFKLPTGALAELVMNPIAHGGS